MTEPRLWTREGFVDDDPWTIVTDDGETAFDGNARQVLPLARYLSLDDADRLKIKGVLVGPADDVLALEPHLGNLDLVAVTFPAFNDGRAFSQASLLRSRLGYAGDIRATGDVLIDQIPLMLRCGVTSFVVSNPTALRRLGEGRLPSIDTYYQPAAVPTRSAGKYSWRRTPGAAA
jgi:uncharacterized protein (DUF934 family)